MSGCERGFYCILQPDFWCLMQAFRGLWWKCTKCCSPIRSACEGISCYRTPLKPLCGCTCLQISCVCLFWIYFTIGLVVVSFRLTDDTHLSIETGYCNRKWSVQVHHTLVSILLVSLYLAFFVFKRTVGTESLMCNFWTELQ